jgi:hypothetical protein
MTRPRRPLGRALDAVRDPRRRRVLLALLEHGPDAASGVDAEVVAPSTADPDRLTTSLVHVHLPKLSDLRYVRWDRETTYVRRGPAFSEVAPLVRLLHDHRTDLPYAWP